MNEFDSTTKATIGENVRTLVDRGNETVEAIRAKVADVRSSVSHGGAQAFDKTVSFVEANPLKAIGLAFGLGYVAMRIMTSPVLKLAMLGGLGYAGRSIVTRARAA